MTEKDPNKNVYFIGIGGISMSGLALVLKERGYAVSGSDSKSSEITENLLENGIEVYIGQKKENIKDNIDMAVYTAAISRDNPELVECISRGIELVPRSKLLGIIMGKYENSIAVAGTHGKTTTTSMISQLLIDANLDPTISIGGIIPSINSNTRIGASEYFVAEACEYTNSFLELNPKAAIVLNIELDHIDYFKNMEELSASFKGFVSNVRDGGAVVINNDIEGYENICTGKNTITFGLSSNANWQAKNIVPKKEGTEFELIHNGKSCGTARLPLPGNHNVTNCLAACAAAHFLGVSEDALAGLIQNFSGTKRRFEFKGEKNGLTVIDDYAHHPSEIKATLQAAKTRAENGKIYCVFQPHTYSRTKAFLEEFSESFDEADTVILTNIYAAREKDPGDISSVMLKDKMDKRGNKVVYLPAFDEIVDYLIQNCENGDMILTMGAGDIYTVGESYLNK